MYSGQKLPHAVLQNHTTGFKLYLDKSNILSNISQLYHISRGLSDFSTTDRAVHGDDHAFYTTTNNVFFSRRIF